MIHVGGEARLLLRWRDTTHGEDCQFELARDLRLRCLPQVSFSGFADSSCRTPALVWPDDQPLPPHARGTGALVCEGAATDVYEVGAPSAEHDVWIAYNGQCVNGGDVSPGTTVYRLDQTVAPEQFVAARATHELRGPQLAARVLVADDGARQIVGIEDTRRSQPCWAASWLGDYCLPTAAWITDYALDATCATPVAYQGFTPGAAGICDEPQVAVATTGQCGIVPTLFATAGEQSSTVYQGGDTCSLAPPDLNHRYFAVGPVTPATEYVHLEKALQGAGRLRTIVYRERGGDALTPLAFHDTLRDVECVPTRFIDGSLRCLATNAASRTLLFVDSACTREVVLVARNGFGCASPPPTEAVELDAAGRVVQLYNVGAAIPPVLLWQTDPVFGCTSASTPLGDWDFYPLGHALDPDALPFVVELTE